MWLHKELCFLNKKVLILVLPYSCDNYKVIDNIYTQILFLFWFQYKNIIMKILWWNLEKELMLIISKLELCVNLARISLKILTVLKNENNLIQKNDNSKFKFALQKIWN